ncbi:MAG: alpha,alpha-trehalase TreF [Spirosomataceae bacterium]
MKNINVSMNLALELQELFSVIQLSGYFSDSKTFNDCIPKSNPDTILTAYRSEKDKDNFELPSFIEQHFQLPNHDTTEYHSDTSKSIEQHLHELWDVLTRHSNAQRDSCILLPFPYIVPGGRFQEIYYWDSYFTMLGLQVSRRIDLIENMVANFAYLIETIGHIPNGNRSYYISRSQPPFFALMLQLLAEEKGKQFVYTMYGKTLQKEYDFWMKKYKQFTDNEVITYRRIVALDEKHNLNRYWDDDDCPRPEAFKEDLEVAHHAPDRNPSQVYRDIRAAAESGWDFSGRWLADGINLSSIQTTSLIPVDLNCLLLNMEEMLYQLAQFDNDLTAISHYSTLIKQRKEAINTYCWDESTGFYFDYQFEKKRTTGIFTLAAVFPLFFKVASERQAELVATTLEKNFLKSGGLVTTLSETSQQWDAPNGWAPLQWMAYKGLQNYGFDQLANEIKTRWVSLNKQVYTETGKMTEKYNVIDSDKAGGGGEYPNQDGFGWTNGVLLKFLQEDV